MHNLIDLKNGASVVGLLFPANLANGNGTSRRMPGGGPTLNAVLTVGAGGGSGTVKVQESDDESTWTDIADSTFTVTSGDASSVMVKLLKRSKKYLRAVTASVSGTAPAALVVAENRVYAAATGANSGTQVA